MNLLLPFVFHLTPLLSPFRLCVLITTGGTTKDQRKDTLTFILVDDSTSHSVDLSFKISRLFINDPLGVRGS